MSLPKSYGIGLGWPLGAGQGGALVIPVVVLKPVNLTAPAVTGTAQVGVLLSGNSGNWSNAPTSYSYVWAVAGTTVSTSPSYTPVTADAAKSGNYTVTATNGAGSTAATSVAFGPITAAAAVAPVNQTAPAITGTPQVGVLLSGNTGTWSNSPTSYSYVWTVAGVTVATTSSYTPVTADASKSGTYAVTATNAAGSTAATPVAFGPIAAAAAGGTPAALAVNSFSLAA